MSLFKLPFEPILLGMVRVQHTAWGHRRSFSTRSSRSRSSAGDGAAVHSRHGQHSGSPARKRDDVKRSERGAHADLRLFSSPSPLLRTPFWQEAAHTRNSFRFTFASNFPDKSTKKSSNSPNKFSPPLQPLHPEFPHAPPPPPPHPHLFTTQPRPVGAQPGGLCRPPPVVRSSPRPAGPRPRPAPPHPTGTRLAPPRPEVV